MTDIPPLSDIWNHGTGKQRKTAALDTLEVLRKDVLAAIREVVITKARTTGHPVCADDAFAAYQELCDMNPKLLLISHNFLGAVFRGKQWEAVGWALGKRPEAHARAVRLWEYVGE